MRVVRPSFAIALALGLLLALPLQGCGGAAATPPTAGSPAGGDPTRGATEAYLALCDMSGQIEAGELDRAEATFHDEIHEALHELADRLETTDRAASAALLVAKARVEEDLAREPIDGRALRGDVETLLGAMRDALEAAGDPPPACPAETSA